MEWTVDSDGVKETSVKAKDLTVKRTTKDTKNYS